MDAGSQPELLTTSEVAALLRVSEMTVRNYAEEWGGRKYGRAWKFPADRIHALLHPADGGQRSVP